MVVAKATTAVNTRITKKMMTALRTAGSAQRRAKNEGRGCPVVWGKDVMNTVSLFISSYLNSMTVPHTTVQMFGVGHLEKFHKLLTHVGSYLSYSEY